MVFFTGGVLNNAYFKKYANDITEYKQIQLLLGVEEKLSGEYGEFLITRNTDTKEYKLIKVENKTLKLNEARKNFIDGIVNAIQNSESTSQKEFLKQLIPKNNVNEQEYFQTQMQKQELKQDEKSKGKTE